MAKSVLHDPLSVRWREWRCKWGGYSPQRHKGHQENARTEPFESFFQAVFVSLELQSGEFADFREDFSTKDEDDLVAAVPRSVFVVNFFCSLRVVGSRGNMR
jgi:hypothetical protein